MKKEPLESMPHQDTSKLSDIQEIEGSFKSLSKQTNQPSSVIVESPLSNKKMTLLYKSSSCMRNSRERKSSKTLGQDLTLREKDLTPYWNDFSEKINSLLWLPAKTALLDLELKSSNSLSRKMVENSWFSIKMNSAPVKNLLKISLPSSLFSPVGCMGSEDTLNKSKKIRVYPTSLQKNLFSQWFGASRFIFNESIKHLNLPEVMASWKSIKTGIIQELPEWSESIPYQIKSIAIRDCCGAIQNAKKKFKATGEVQKVSFRSRKNPTQSCYIPKSAIKELGIYHTLSKELKWSESLPEECLDARLVRNNGRFYVAIPYKSTVKVSENQGRIVALDPGVRSFMTFYSEQSCGKLGYGDFKRIFRLCKVIDKFQSILSDKNLMYYKRCNLKKSLGRLRWKVRDLISELHHKVALFLVKNFDVIFLPTFEVSEMVNRIGRKIRSKTARQMLTLGHFRFKGFLKHKAFEYGKQVIDVCEAYTTKTVSWTGEIVESLGGRRVIVSRADGREMDRDINGARGIFLRALGDTPIFKRYIEDKLMMESI